MMKRSTQARTRRLATIAVAGALSVGSIALASPAVARPWGGNLTCPGSISVVGRAQRGQAGIMYARAGSTEASTANMLVITLDARAGTNIASWEVTGQGAGSGIGFCG